jgi:hypothetical protein
MATFQRFKFFLRGLCLKEHDLSVDTLKIYLSNATPDQNGHMDKSEIAEISSGSGYTAGGVTLSKSLSTGLATVWLYANANPSWTASGGSIGPFRYAILYNDTHASDRLIGYWDRGSSMTLADGETFTLDLGNIFTIS